MENKKESTVVTMKNVAEMAGVSTATVSRTLMNPKKVSTLTRQKVEQAARATGYLPQALSHRIKRNDSRTILVIISDISDPSFIEIIQGIEQTAAGHGYLILISSCAPQHQFERTVVNLIMTKQKDRNKINNIKAIIGILLLLLLSLLLSLF